MPRSLAGDNVESGSSPTGQLGSPLPGQVGRWTD